MTDAQLERISPDAWLAGDFLGRAKLFAIDGARDQLRTESRQVLLHNAVIAACDALLAVKGYQVTGSDGGHRLRISKASELLPDAHVELFESLDDARVSRNDASYAAAPVPALEIEDTVVDVRTLIGLVDREVKPLLPEWRSGAEDDSGGR